MKNIKLLLLCLLISSTTICQYKHVITFFIRKHPSVKLPLSLNDVRDKIAQPGKIGTRILKQSLKTYDNFGIFVVYAGYLNMSNIDGEVTFPRLIQKPILQILVTKEIEIIKKISNVVDHIEINIKEKDSELYSVIKYKDKETQLFYWKIKKENIENNNFIIKPNTIVILANPKNIYIPEGITLTTPSPQLYLPDIYAKKGIDLSSNSLSLLLYKQYFEPIRKAYKKNNNTYASMLSNY